MQLGFTVTGPLDPHRLREAVHAVVTRHPHLVARFCDQFEEPVQIIPADPVPGWRYVELDGGDTESSMSMSRSQRVCAAERAAVCDLADEPAFRAALIRIAADRHRFVLTNHHIVLDGWSLPILLGEIFAGYHGQRLGAAVPYRRFVDLAGRSGPGGRPRGLAGRCWPVLTPPPWWARRAGWGWAARRCLVSGARADHAGRWRAGALVSHHRQHRVAGRLRAAAVLADRPARCRLRHRGLGSAGRGGRRGIDGGPVDQHGAGAGDHHARQPPPPTCSTSCKAPTTTPWSISTWRSPRSTASPATSSCSTPCSCTRTTRSTPPRLAGADELAITDFTSRESTHYPLTVLAGPGASWVFASNTTPRCSTRPASRR